jgi:hypothetical protein
VLEVELATRAWGEDEAVLVVDVAPHAVVPGRCYLSTEVAGGFTGWLLGMTAERRG